LNALSVTVICALLLAACSGGIEAAATPPPGGGKLTSRGFECPEPAIRQSEPAGVLHVLVRTEYISPDILECFELVYGVRVDRDEYSRNEEIFDRLTSETGYDLALVPDYLVSPLIQRGILQNINKANLPLLRNLDSDYLNFSFDPGNEFTLPYQAGTNAIVVNTETTRNLPDSWDDLWNPEYGDRLVVLDDSRTMIGATLLTLGYDVNTTEVSRLEQARAKLLELVPGIKLFDSDSPKTALISGDADLGITWTGEAFLAIQDNPDLKYIYPAEGAIFWQDNWVVPAGAQNPDAAYAWLNYTMQGDVFWMSLKDFPYINPNLAALEYARANHPDVYEAYMNSPVTNVPAEALVNSHRIEDVGDSLPLYYQIWSELRGG
jgi:spermidine/putrescine-binding protein